jgi:hypothetical protein
MAYRNAQPAGPAQGPRRAAWLSRHALPSLALVLLCTGALACSSMPPMEWWPLGSGGDEGTAEASEESTVELERLHRGELHCAENECENLYGVRVEQGGRLQAEVYAPWGEGMPEFNLALLDAAQQPVARPVDPDGRPRRVVMFVEPGLYYVRVNARGNRDGRLKYDLLAKVLDAKPTRAVRGDAPKPSKQTAAKVSPTKTASSSATSTPAGGTDVALETAAPLRVPQRSASQILLVNAEVLDVEEAEDEKLYVLLDRGAPDAVEQGMTGELVDQGVIIGSFEIEEVYPDGSRARVQGTLSGQVGIDTIAAIYR